MIELYKSELNRVLAADQPWDRLSMTEKRRVAAKVIGARGGNENEHLAMLINMNIPNYSIFVVSNDTVNPPTTRRRFF